MLTRRLGRVDASLAADVALALVIGLVAIGGTAMAATHQSDRDLGVAGVALLLTAVGALLLRRRHAVPVLGVVLVATATYWSLDYARGPVFLPLVAAFVTVVLQGRRLVAFTSLAVGFLVFPWGGYLLGRVDERPGWGELLALAAWLTTLVSIAEMARYRKDRAEAAARSEAEAVRRRATEERLRIARELHDVVAHNMSLINLQAGVALHLIDQQPDQARASLAVIKDASKDALVELRSILGVLRQVDEEHELAPRSPTSGLAGLDDLVARAEAAGVDVRVDADDVEGIPGHVDLAAYRIIQESLTNVARHSDDTNPLVRLRRGQADLIVEVLDEGRSTTMATMVDGTPSGIGGYGIAGMRERALALGGHLEAGPRPGQGFAVRAWLPLATDDAGDVETGGLRDHGGPEGRNDEETAR